MENDFYLKYFFPTNYQSIMDRVNSILPDSYVKNRNFIDGDVTLLSPYISRGVISTAVVLRHLITKNYDLKSIRKFIQELAWRDYWQLRWQHLGEQINQDLRDPQKGVNNDQFSTAIKQGQTGIKAIDDAIAYFYQTGYLHNHVRMYIASLACNIAASHWLKPAQWMYYHLLDGDWASNALSWQWVVGTNAQKKYVANQENINKYCYTQQKGSYLDTSYEALKNIKTPEVLSGYENINLSTKLPKQQAININKDDPTLIYNYYNMDPIWHNDLKANRVLLLEPSIFEKYPVSDKSINFMMDLSNNIENIMVYVGEFDDFKKNHPCQKIIYKEHPLNQHYTGLQESRDWMFDVQDDYQSFFKFWKACTQSTQLEL